VESLPPRARREELAALGQAEARVTCGKCGYFRGEILDTATWEVIGRITPQYPDGYLFKDGKGRMRRAEARRAYMIRTGRI
jgi:hypothetical protein